LYESILSGWQAVGRDRLTFARRRLSKGTCNKTLAAAHADRTYGPNHGGMVEKKISSNTKV
jgi:hypothetical protein